jgi:hypothetical protein
VNECGVAFVCDPASIRIEMCCVIAAFVEGKDGYQANTGVGDI